MDNLSYEQMHDENDIMIPKLKEIYRLPEVSRYLNISDNYFCYVTKTYGVYFYKVWNKDELIGAIHLELNENLLHMDILIFPKFQRKGFATKVIEDIQNDIFKLNYNKIETSIDETNSASLKLFESAGFMYLVCLHFVHRAHRTEQKKFEIYLELIHGVQIYS